MKYYFYRHAQTDANLKGLLSCEHHEVLNETGRLQSRQLCEYLPLLSFDVAWISPVPRALDTIMPYCLENELKYEIMPVLSEGCYNLNPHEQISPPSYDSNGLPVPNESVEQFRGRVLCFIDPMFNQHTDQSVLVLSHGQFIRELLNMLLGAARYVRWPVANCSETLIEITDDVFIHHVNKSVIKQT